MASEEQRFPSVGIGEDCRYTAHGLLGSALCWSKDGSCTWPSSVLPGVSVETGLKSGWHLSVGDGRQGPSDQKEHGWLIVV